MAGRRVKHSANILWLFAEKSLGVVATCRRQAYECLCCGGAILGRERRYRSGPNTGGPAEQHAPRFGPASLLALGISKILLLSEARRAEGG
jgi:hypothetical protein